MIVSSLIPGTPNPVLSYALDFPYLDIFATVHIHVLMSDEKEGRKKEASKIKQTTIKAK